ncbi:MAG: hypothetical protein ACFFC7_06735 [Candidatus Hermodarchaeota archaeon]
MSLDIQAIETQLQSIVNIGAELAVLADMSGLPLCITSKVTNVSSEPDAVSAFASWILNLGSIVEREVPGAFANATLRTSGPNAHVVLATIIDSEPVTMVMAVTSLAYEAQVQREMNRLKGSISGAMVGKVTDFKPLLADEPKQDVFKINAFFSTLKENMQQTVSLSDLYELVETAKNNLTIMDISRFAPAVTYHMNRFGMRIKQEMRRAGKNKAKLAEGLESLREMGLVEVETWRSKLVTKSE